jgi:ATP-binding cassette subfamily B protein
MRALRRLGEYVARYRTRLLAGIVLFFVSRVFEGLVFYFMGVGLDTIADLLRQPVEQADTSRLLWPMLAILGCVAGRFTVVTQARLLIRRTGILCSYDLRQRLYDRLQQQGLYFFNRYTIGDMMTRAVADIGLIQRMFSHGTIMLVIMVYAPVVGLSFMLASSWQLTLLILPPLPFVYFYARRASRRLGIASRDVQDRLSDLGTQVQENLSGIRTIQAMVQEENEIRRFDVQNQAYADAFYAQARIQSLMGAVMPTLASLCAISILGYGGLLVLDGSMTVGQFGAFFLYVGMVVQPFRTAGMVINMFQRAAVATERLWEIFDLEPEIPDRPAAGVPERIAGRVQLHRLTYAYAGTTRNVLEDVTLDIAAGESVTIMGRVGSGKSTLLRLLVRLLDPPPGSVRIDGHDVRDYPLPQLRAQVALVPQDPFLFGEALKANITYDDPERTLDAIWDAAESARLRQTIEEFPEQMDTVVGERGVTLSGGQKQRTTLARGFIRGAPVLVLDDCFSAVDTETEEHILSALRRLRRDRTTILVSHRVSTARHSDRIVVLDHGRIAEVGTHDELVARGGFYAELERIQREGASSEDIARGGVLA